ncbi:MAG: hypothetical protein J6A15_00565 [Clostridia bacterium]|nr:hypothetical protein [Clostridia bacterium]
MGLFLLGIPMALVGAKIIKNDIDSNKEYYSIPKANLTNLNDQYNQINSIEKQLIEYSKNDIEKLLAKKGYRKEAIDYALYKYDTLINQKQSESNTNRDNRIRAFEDKLTTQNTHYDLWETNVCYYAPKKIVEKNVDKMLQYLQTHGHEQAYCNIVMDGYQPNHNHSEIWAINTPNNASIREVNQYIDDVRNKVLGEN